MERLFFRLLNMSLAAVAVIAVVVLLRLFLRYAPKKWQYLLWSAVGFRLCCPVSFKAAFSLFRLKPTIMNSFGGAENVVILPQSMPSAAQLAVPAASAATAAAPITPAAVPAVIPAASMPAAEMIRLWPTLGIVLWLCGMAVMLALGIIRYIRMKRGLADAAALEKSVFATDRIRVPFILGLLPPRVYVPAGLGEEERKYVLAHERAHIRRGDHWVKLLAYLLLAVHWFNPAVWAAFFLMSRDMEMSCDERVLRELGGQAKAYSRTLLRFAEGRQFPAPAPLGFGESDVKSRIKNALRWKKPKLWITLAATVLCIAAVAACTADPKEPKETDMPATADTPWSWTSTLKATDIREAALKSGSVQEEVLLTEEQIGELTALLNAVPRDQVAGGRGIPSERVLELRDTGYALRFAGGVIELDCEAPRASAASGYPAWEIRDETLNAWLNALWTESPFGKSEDPLGLTMSVKDASPTGCTLMLAQTGGNAAGKLQTGAAFFLYKQNADGIWEEFEALRKGIWYDLAYSIPKGSATLLTADWIHILGPLEDGHYRIEKKIMDVRGEGDYNTYSVFAEFDILGDAGTKTSGRFTVSADKCETWASGTIQVFEKEQSLLSVRILAELQIGPEDFGGVAFYLPAGCVLENVSCTYPEIGGAAGSDPPVNVWTTEGENEKYTTAIEIGRSRDEIPGGGGTGTVIIEASYPRDSGDPIRSMAFGVECGAEEKDGYVIMGIEHSEIVVEIRSP